MTTKKLNVKLFKSGSENDALTRLISNYNEGIEKAQITPRDIEGYLLTRNAIFSSINNYKLVKDETNPNTYNISEDGGKTFTISIEWAEIYSLDDVSEPLNGMPEVDREIENELID